MGHAGWDDVWNLVLALVRAQPVQFQILIGLAVALASVMILEGLRASFLPGYRALPHRPHIRNAAATQPNAAAKAPGAEIKSRASAPFRPRQIENARNLKRAKLRVSRHRPARPQIRRVSLGGFTNSFSALSEQNHAPQPMVTENAVSFSPLSPFREQSEV